MRTSSKMVIFEFFNGDCLFYDAEKGRIHKISFMSPLHLMTVFIIPGGR